MTVDIHRDLNGGVAGEDLDLFRLPALPDADRDRAMAQAIEAVAGRAGFGSRSCSLDCRRHWETRDRAGRQAADVAIDRAGLLPAARYRRSGAMILTWSC